MATNRQFHEAKVQILPDIPIPDKYIRGFQHALETLAADTKMPVALIMRLKRSKIEVFSTNPHPANPYSAGSCETLPAGLYCETVIKTGMHLIISNALKDPLWQDNPDIKYSMVAYMGLPIYWPQGEVFGTICLLNNKEHHFSDFELEFITTVRNAIQSDLDLIYRDYCIKYRLTPQPEETTVASRL